MVARDMKILVLGLLCLVEVVVCRTCVGRFDDIKSRALVSDFVVEGRVQSHSRSVNDRYNATIKLSKKKIYKGPASLKKQRRITVAGFAAEENAELCSAPVVIGKSYLLFLTTLPSDPSGVYRLARLPAKVTKKNIRDIKKIVCNKCAKAPTIKNLKAVTVKQGKKISLRCKVSANPRPDITWLKDGVVVRKRKGLKIKNNKKGTQSLLKISKAKARDAGVYTCKAANIEGETTRDAAVQVLAQETTTPAPTTQSHFIGCINESLCFNGGTCAYIPKLREEFCRCPAGYEGDRCEREAVNIERPGFREAKKLEEQRNMIVGVMGIAIGLLVLLLLILFFVYRRRRTRQRKYATNAERTALNSYLREDDVDHMSPKAGQGDIPMVTFRKELMRATSMTQTEPVHIGPVNLEDFLPLAEPQLRMANDAHRYSTTSTGSRRPSRKRISGVSQTPGASTEGLDKGDNPPAADEDSSPSQSSKTESCQPVPGSKESTPGSRRRVNGVSDDDDNASNKSEYDNHSNDGIDEIDSPRVVPDQSLSPPSLDPKIFPLLADTPSIEEPFAKNQQSSPLLSGQNNNIAT